MLGAVRPAANADLLAAALAVALEPDEVLAEDDEVLDHAPGNVGHDLPQRGIGRGRHGLVGDLPVDGAVGVGQEDQAIAEVRHHILLSLLALGDRLRRPGRIGEIDQLDVGGREVAGLDHQEAVGQRQPQRDGKALRHLLMDELVVGRSGCRADGERPSAPTCWDRDPRRTAIGRPSTTPRRRAPRGSYRRGPPGREVADLERVALRAVRVDRVGKEIVVRADGRFRHREGAPAARQRVLVEQDLLGPALARPPAVQLALRADLVAGIVLPRPPRLRHRLVAPADARPHLRHQAALERPVGGQHGAGVWPLRLEMLADRLLQRLGRSAAPPPASRSAATHSRPCGRCRGAPTSPACAPPPAAAAAPRPQACCGSRLARAPMRRQRVYARTAGHDSAARRDLTSP